MDQNTIKYTFSETRIHFRYRGQALKEFNKIFNF